MKAEPLIHPEPAGVIWTALVLDYPGHSFSHLGLFFGMRSPNIYLLNSVVLKQCFFAEGTNGRLPNQDLSNSASTISRGMGVPWVLYDHNDEGHVNFKGRGVLVSLLLEIADMIGVDVQDYLRRGRNILRNVGYQATGEPSGVHGVFHK
jgi:glycosylphosphatidylinositol transamidase